MRGRKSLGIPWGAIGKNPSWLKGAIAMKICFYSMREFDELPMAQELSRETGI